MAVLGVADHRFLGLPDGGLAEPRRPGPALVGRLLDEVRPDTILTFGPDGMTFHPDHIAVRRWVTEAWQQRGRPCRLLLRHAHRRPPRPVRRALRGVGHVHDRRAAGRRARRRARRARRASTGRDLDRKLAALAAMASQTRDLDGEYRRRVLAAVSEEFFVERDPVRPGSAGKGAAHSGRCSVTAAG